MQQVEAYLSLEQARFPDRFNVSFDIDPACRNALLPPFIIQVLVENAIRHAFKNRRNNNVVHVTVRGEDDQLYLEVQDNGIGIPEDKLPYIGKAIVHSDTGGTGSALENLNLRLSGLFDTSALLHIDSDTHGTTVSCHIPFPSDNKEVEKLNTLIVDDEPLARNELNYLLTQNGHFETIDEAETIAETLEKLLYETYDVIFLDINLMNESGLDLAENHSKMKQAPYIIFLRQPDNFAVKAFELDATDYILKPFEQNRIDQAVERVAAKLNAASLPGKENAEEQTTSEKSANP